MKGTLPNRFEDLFVLRNAGNTCVHSEGSVMGSLESPGPELGLRVAGLGMISIDRQGPQGFRVQVVFGA